MTPRAPGARWSRAPGAASVLALALAARLAIVAWAAPRIPPAADGTFYHMIAGRIAQGLGYTWLWPDGVVTYAGHYPVGYPGLVGAVYALVGPVPAAAMLLNAVIGSLAAAAAYGLVERSGGRRAAWIAGALVALHPGLVAYTPALMTEGVTASLVMCAAWLSESARGRRPPSARGAAHEARFDARAWVGPVLTGIVVGAATLVRPQSLVLAPIFGWLAARSAGAARGAPRVTTVASGASGASATSGAVDATGAMSGAVGVEDARRAASRVAGWRGSVVRGGMGAAIALSAALLVCAPWAARNCVRMKQCALVSYNGGWNLLIGADEASTGTWAEIKVPASCREVWGEAEKDACFGAAARRYIAEHPGKWLALAPRKLAATFDYAGAGGWYLNAANPSAFPERAKVMLGAIETVFERLVLLAAIFVGARGALGVLRGRRDRGARARDRSGPIEARGADETARALEGRGAHATTGARGTGGGRAWWWAVVTVAAAGPAAASVLWQHVWVGYLLLPVVLATGMRSRTSAPRRDGEGAGLRPTPKISEMTLIACTIAVLLSLGATHAVFFGAGRYSLVAFPFVTAVAGLLFARGPKEGREAGEDGAAEGAETPAPHGERSEKPPTF